MKHRFRIIDADGHVIEPRHVGALHRAGVPGPRATGGEASERPHPHVRRRAPGTARGGPELGQPRHADLVLPAHPRSVGPYLDAQYSPESQVKALDEGGIEMSFLYPSRGLYTAAVDDLDPALAFAICRAYNDWIVDFCAYAPDRLKPVGMLRTVEGEDFPLAEGMQRGFQSGAQPVVNLRAQ